MLSVHAGAARIYAGDDEACVRHGVALEHGGNGGRVLEGRYVDTDALVALAAVGNDLIAELAAGRLMSDHVFTGLDLRNLGAKIDLAVGQHGERLTDDLDGLVVLEDADNDSGKDVT
jgi:hypothetical protein